MATLENYLMANLRQKRIEEKTGRIMEKKDTEQGKEQGRFALTQTLSVQLHSHGNMSVPRDWHKSDVSALDWPREHVTHDRVPVAVAMESLKNKPAIYRVKRVR